MNLATTKFSQTPSVLQALKIIACNSALVTKIQLLLCCTFVKELGAAGNGSAGTSAKSAVPNIGRVMSARAISHTDDGNSKWYCHNG